MVAPVCRLLTVLLVNVLYPSQGQLVNLVYDFFYSSLSIWIFLNACFKSIVSQCRLKMDTHHQLTTQISTYGERKLNIIAMKGSR